MTNEEETIIEETTRFTIANYISQAFFMVRGFFIARLLGPALYGYWSIIKSFLITGFFLNMGMTNGMLREVPFYRGQDDVDQVYLLQQSTLTWNVLLSLLVALAAICLTTFTDLTTTYVLEMRLAGVAYVLNVIHLFVTSKQRSENNIRLLSNYTIAYSILNTIFGLAFLFFYQISGILLGMLITNLLLLAYLVKTKNLSLRFKLDFKVIKRLIKIGFPILIIGMAIMLMNHIDKLIVFMMLGGTMTGYYGIATFISSIVNSIPLSVSSVIMPKMMYTYGKTQNRREIEKYYLKPIVILTGFIPIILGIIYINIPLPIIYLLPMYEPAIDVLRILTLGVYFSSIIGVPANIIVALRKQSILMWLILSTLVSGAILDVGIISMGFGLRGVAVCTVLAFFMAAIITNAYALFILRKNLHEMLLMGLKIFGPFVYLFMGLKLVQVSTSVDHLVFNALIQSLLFLVLCVPLVIHVNRNSGVITMFVAMHFRKK